MLERPGPEGVSLSQTLRGKNGEPWEEKVPAEFHSAYHTSFIQQPYRFLLLGTPPSMTLPTPTLPFKSHQSASGRPEVFRRHDPKTVEPGIHAPLVCLCSFSGP